jgi:hypothetical protein
MVLSGRCVMAAGTMGSSYGPSVMLGRDPARGQSKQKGPPGAQSNVGGVLYLQFESRNMSVTSVALVTY